MVLLRSFVQSQFYRPHVERVHVLMHVDVPVHLPVHLPPPLGTHLGDDEARHVRARERVLPGVLQLAVEARNVLD